MTSPRKKSIGVKPVKKKGWVFVNPAGEWQGVRFNSEEQLWDLAFDAYRATEKAERLTYSQIKALLKKKGFRVIPVLISPITK